MCKYSQLFINKLFKYLYLTIGIIINYFLYVYNYIVEKTHQ